MARDQVGWVARAGGLLGVGPGEDGGGDTGALSHTRSVVVHLTYIARPRY